MTATEPQAGVEIEVDGATVDAKPGEMLIEACERSGTYIPRFCYHSRMSPVGMCRMCLVEVDTGRGFALQPSCMVPVSEGMKVSTESEVTKKAQDGVLEFLLINHPLDCPVCDKGGECPLQDQTMAYGPGETRFVEEKRHFAKPIAISETVYLDRERCILCDRCTRFADEVAGDALIHFMGRGNHTEVNTFPDEPFASYFSGNTVQICPVGALTAAPYRFKARPWDLTETLSTAWVDSVGARVAVQASRNRVLRVLGADADAVNWGWLTDKERFGFEALNSAERLSAPMLRDAAGGGASEWREAGWGEALDRIAGAVGAVPPERVAVLGGARLNNEAQYMWAKLAKGVIGTDNVDAQLGDGLDPAMLLALPRATIDDACRPGGTVVLIGPDPKEELGTLYLRLRHAAINDGVKLVEVTPHATGLSHLAKHSLRPFPGTTAALARTLVLATEPKVLAAAESGEMLDEVTAGAEFSEVDELRELLKTAGAALGVDAESIKSAALALAGAAGEVTVLLGRASLAEGAEVVEAAAAELSALPSVRFLPALRRGNVLGALEAGLAPGLLPGGGIRVKDTEPAGDAEAVEHAGAVEATESGGAVGAVGGAWPRLPAAAGLDAAGVLRAAARGDVDVLVLVGADPLNDFIDRDLAYRGLRGASLVVAVDLFVNDSASLAADIVLPAAGPTECDGTFTNLEGRVSPMSRKVTPPGTARPDWMIAADLAERLEPGSAEGLDSPESIREELARVSEVHASLTEEALDASPVEGVLLTRPGATGEAGGRPATGPAGRETSLEEVPEGAFLLVATRTMYDDGTMLRHCPSSQGLAPAASARINPADLDAGGPGEGAAVRIVSDFGHIEATLVTDAGVPAGSLKVHWLAPGSPANSLIAAGTDVTMVTVEAR
ncbi:MAG: NADH-quinone oxidoreductase subunit NuoG [Acidimicrobiaceae bacterium]|nr:NADH-quinone oxidoreductase subunit NuoG [Acidimicrobiaceae bacterium]MYI52701.1 NADH-quinone oxidoreductase subunit NuoG [Acidimicrobiaceae bacterium]